MSALAEPLSLHGTQERRDAVLAARFREANHVLLDVKVWKPASYQNTTRYDLYFRHVGEWFLDDDGDRFSYLLQARSFEELDRWTAGPFELERMLWEGRRIRHENRLGRYEQTRKLGLERDRYGYWAGYCLCYELGQRGTMYETTRLAPEDEWRFLVERRAAQAGYVATELAALAAIDAEVARIVGGAPVEVD
jgi:hypothetical protein